MPLCDECRDDAHVTPAERAVPDQGTVPTPSLATAVSVVGLGLFAAGVYSYYGLAGALLSTGVYLLLRARDLEGCDL